MMVLIVVLLISNSMAIAQETVIIKNKPDLRNYHYELGDPYKPGVMGFASFVLPGLGEMLEGETVRGIVFLGGIAGLNAIRMSILLHGESGSSPESFTAIRIAKLTLHLLSMIDAVHMAKVNNIEFRTQNKTAVFLNLVPYLGSDDYNQPVNNIPVGLTLLINF